MGNFKHTEESKKKMREAHKGRVVTEEWKQHLKDAKKRQRERDGYINSPEARKKLSVSKTGVPRPEWVREKMRGKNASGWKGGVSVINDIVRECLKYRQWRSDIFTRDEFTCKQCGAWGGRINADHIIPLSVLIAVYEIRTLSDALRCEEIWNLNNGRTLCESCHRKTDTYGHKAKRHTAR